MLDAQEHLVNRTESQVWRKLRGFNLRAHSEHEGVAVVRDKQRNVIAFRWREPGTSRKRQTDARLPAGTEKEHDRVFEYSGRRIESRGQARLLAVRLSTWLARELSVFELRRAGDPRVALPRDGKQSWDQLREKHDEELRLRGSSEKTLQNYAGAWRLVKKWLGSNQYWPHELNREYLRSFVRFLIDYRTTWGEPLSSSSIRSRCIHLKAILNFGRRNLETVALSGEAVNAALKSGKGERRAPVALRSDQLASIIRAARINDVADPEHPVFPLLLFLMVAGCRRGEALSLRFEPSVLGAAESWIDLSRGIVVIWGKKTSRQRILPLNTRPLLSKVLHQLASSKKKGRGGVRFRRVSTARAWR